MGGPLAAPDYIYEPEEEGAFHHAKRGWHEGAMARLPAHRLAKVLMYLECDSISGACEKLEDLGEFEYIHYLQMLAEE